MLARSVAYAAAAAHLKKGTTIDSFWPVGEKRLSKIEALKERVKKRGKKAHFPDKLPIKNGT